jgi:L-fuculose-phosphate aldolase
MDAVKQAKKDIIHVCRRLYEREMVASNDGNVTVRVGEDRIIATPTGKSKGFLTEDDLVLTDMEGRLLEGSDKKVTSEIKIYIKIYQLRPDVLAAVHAHPLHATACAVAGRSVAEDVLPESVLGLGRVPLVPYGTPGTDELAEAIAPYLEDHEVFLLANHGALALGQNVIEAYHRMECLEHTARIVFLAEGMGWVNRLTPEQIVKIFEVHGSKVSERIRKFGASFSKGRTEA